MSEQSQPRKRGVGGAAFRRQKGQVTVNVPMSPDQRARLHEAAAAASQPLTVWCAAALLAAAQKSAESGTSP